MILKKNIILPFLIFLYYFLSPALMAQVPSWQWVNTTPGGFYEIPTAISNDPTGAAYVTGFFDDSVITFGTTTLVNSGHYSDLFIVKYNTNGSVSWAKKAGGADDESMESLVADKEGNIYVSGVFNSDTITFDTVALYHSGIPGSEIDFFIAKYDSSGQIKWAKSFRNNGNEKVWSLANDPVVSGGFYATGEFDGDSLVLDTTVIYNNGTIRMFVARFDANGNLVWAKNHAGNGGARPHSISISDSSSIYISGDFFNYPVIFGADTLATQGLEDIFLVKYDLNGNALWARSGTGNGPDIGNAVVAEKKQDGNIYISGGFKSDTLTLDTISLFSKAKDIYLAKYDASGNLLWAKREGAHFDEQTICMGIDPNGSVYTGGWFRSDSIKFGTTWIFNTNVSSTDIFIVKHDSTGNPLWAKSIGGNSDDKLLSLAVDTLFNIYAAGYYASNTIGFDSINLTNTGYFDMFAGKSGMSSTVGIDEKKTRPQAVYLYPNPTPGIIRIKGTVPFISYEVYSISGQKIAAGNLNPENPYVDITNYPSGLYGVLLFSEKESLLRKIVKW